MWTARLLQESTTLSSSEIVQFFQQFSTLLESGFSPSESLKMASRDGSTAFRRELKKASAAVAAGRDLAGALALSGYFDGWTTSLVRLAEHSGTVPETCRRLAVSIARQEQRDALVRQCQIAAMAIAWSLLLLVAASFKPTPQALLEPQFWLNGLGLALVVGLLGVWLDRVRSERLNRLGQKLPVVGDILQARSLLFLGELELPLSCGVPITTALDLARSRYPDPAMARLLAIALSDLRSGHPLSHSLDGNIPDTALAIVRVGEETGNLDSALHQIAERYEGELERILQQLRGILFPLSVVTVGGVVALFAVASLLSLLSTME